MNAQGAQTGSEVCRYLYRLAFIEPLCKAGTFFRLFEKLSREGFLLERLRTVLVSRLAL